MYTLINELQHALKAGLYLTSLSSSVMIPDICSALESNDGKTSGAKYKVWVDEYISPKYGGTVTGEVVYKLRCALLHQGKFNHDYPNYDKILFQLPNSFMTHNVLIGNALTLNIQQFCEDLVNGYFAWEQKKSSDENVRRNYLKIVNYHPDGVLPFIEGVPMFA